MTGPMSVYDACRLLADYITLLSAARVRIADLQVERDGYREILTAALDEIAALTTRVGRQRAMIVRFLAELREARERAA